MRISDWSSDVCSSDLVGGAVHDPAVVAVCNDVGGFVFVGEVAGDGFEDIDGRYQSFDRAELIDDDDQLAACRLTRLYQVEYACGLVHQIGRATCRERVCQYV